MNISDEELTQEWAKAKEFAERLAQAWEDGERAGQFNHSTHWVKVSNPYRSKDGK